MLGAKSFRDSVQFWFEAPEVTPTADYGGSEFGEVMATSRHVKSGDCDSCLDVWRATRSFGKHRCLTRLSDRSYKIPPTFFLRATTPER
jgi:hypothetical protein